MKEKKICQRCGKSFDSYFGETLCWSCNKAKNLEDVQESILSGEETSTDCENDVICPWCGEVIEPDCESSEFYEDGTHVMRCPECDKEFTLSTSVSYSYSTERELPRYILEDRKRAQEAREKMRKAQEG